MLLKHLKPHLERFFFFFFGIWLKPSKIVPTHIEKTNYFLNNDFFV